MTGRVVVALVVVALAGRDTLALAAPFQPPGDSTGRIEQTGDPELMARFLGSVPIGSALKLRTGDGRRTRVVLMAVDPDAIVVQRRGRRPEPPYRVPFASIAAAEVDKGRTSPAVAIGIGVLSGAAAFVTMLVVLIANVED